jgi:hypothetical protein
MRVARYFARLMDLSETAPLEPVIHDVLELLAAITRAEIVYLEVPSVSEAPLRAVYPRGDIDAIRGLISHGIVRSALAECKTISTPAALNDDRFAHLGSVQQHEIRAVVCSPIKVQGVLGLIYLQGLTELTAFHRELVEDFSRKLGRRLAWPLVQPDRMTMDQATEAFRRWFALEVLERCGWKGTAAAEALRISRSTLYELVGDLRLRRRVNAG